MEADRSGDWRPTADLEVLRLRARMLAGMREFFGRHGVLEVETPALSAAGATDPHLQSFTVLCAAQPAPRYLHTSPEFAMKRLLAAGSGSIFQICKVFRDNESGRLHNAEFTLLEWYRVGMSYHELMDEVAALVTEALAGRRALGAVEKISYGEAFMQGCGIDPHTAATREMIEIAHKHGVGVAALSDEDRDGWRDLLLTHLIEPRLGRGRLTLVYDYPASAAALARIRPGEPAVAERFEAYLDGIELANGFQELTDAREQRRRFECDLVARERRGLPAIPLDERLLAAMDHGLPECSGVALGVDRLVMLAAGAPAVSRAMAFPIERA